MFDWIINWCAYLFGFKKNAKLLIIGLDNAGKSTLLDRMHSGRMIQNPPTGQARSQELDLGHVRFTAFDMGGHPHVRRVWRDYMLAVDAILFMVDSADIDRLGEVMVELDSVLQHEETKDVPIAVLFNKVDLKHALGEQFLCESLKIDMYRTGKTYTPIESLARRPMETFPCSILKQIGYGEAVRWLANYTK